MCVIIDDRDDVWHFATNLIQVKPYHFFSQTGDINAPAGLQKNELDGKSGVDFNKIVKLHKVKKLADTKTDGAKVPKAEESEDASDSLVEISDPDDYLLYLESILKQIHSRFYEIYDQTKEIPDLKDLVPKLKSEVLKNGEDFNLSMQTYFLNLFHLLVSIVFSGLVPNIVRLENSRPYLIARALGAVVTETILESTTHLVAASVGFTKNDIYNFSKLNLQSTKFIFF